MLAKEFQEVYNQFKQSFYASMCAASSELTMQEAFSLDIIYMLGEPTILEYAKYMGISQPNATYKINQMIEKGYLTKTISPTDKRAFHLKVTQKFLDCYRDNDRYISTILGNIEETFSKEDVELLEKMLIEVTKQLKQQSVTD